jgi:hypothetical protein
MRIPTDRPEFRAGSIVSFRLDDVTHHAIILQRLTVGMALFVVVDTGRDPYIALDTDNCKLVKMPESNPNFHENWRTKMRIIINAYRPPL